MVKSTLTKLGRVISRLLAAAGAIAGAASVALVGFALMLAGVVVVQQTLSRFVGLDVPLGKVLSWSGRIFVLLGRVAGNPELAPA